MKYAVNPLQYYVTPAGEIDWSSGPPYDDVLADVARSGFRAVQSRLRAGTSASDVRSRLAVHGLRPAPGYFAGDLAHPGALPELRARFAEALSSTAELGLSDLVVACPVVPERKATAARRAGSEIDTGALRRITHSLDDLGRTAREQGVRICFHPHVGTAVETPEEIAFVVENTASETVSLCADTGHLAWGGMDDIGAFLGASRGRIGALHLKDIDTRVRRAGVRQGWSYARFVREGIWREPGDGDLDLDAIMRSWRQADLWCVVEVDAPARPTPYESLKACSEYVRRWEG